jgi:hypothetical protein
MFTSMHVPFDIQQCVMAWKLIRVRQYIRTELHIHRWPRSVIASTFVRFDSPQFCRNFITVYIIALPASYHRVYINNIYTKIHFVIRCIFV